jgi:phosphoenolpyruvate synthase/pyruvate phosphate dikinase
MHLRPTLTYQELCEYNDWHEKLPAEEQKKYPSSLEMTGGKGRSLSLMDAVVDVPPGYNVTTAAYFQFVRDNKNVYKKI